MTYLRHQKQHNIIMSINDLDNIPKNILDVFEVYVGEISDDSRKRCYMDANGTPYVTPALPMAGTLVKMLHEAGVLESALASPNAKIASMMDLPTDKPIYEVRSFVSKSSGSSGSKNGLAEYDKVEKIINDLHLRDSSFFKVTASEKTQQVHMSLGGRIPSFAVNGSSDNILALLRDPEVQAMLSDLSPLLSKAEDILAGLKAKHEAQVVASKIKQ
jgi:hypothetical protein